MLAKTGMKLMVDAGGPALGLSIGATTLAATTADNALTRKPVLTLYGDRAAEVGVPAENPRLGRPGLVIGGFVNRVGDPRGVVASDGSVHRSEALLADALRALAYAATRGRPLPEKVAVSYPAHWTSAAVDALGTALGEVPEWSNRPRPLLLIPDAAAALLAVRTNPGLPAEGTVAVCDFGGTGTNITLMGAGGDFQAVAPTVRFAEFSGDLIDQALLSVVVANMPSTGSFEASGSAAIGSLSRLRAGCRSAKERLSISTATGVTDGLTGTRDDTRLTRAELDDAIRPALQRCLAVLDDTLARNDIRDLVAVVSVGGGANLPTVTTALARHFRVPVVTTPRPQLTAAVGAALRVANRAGTPGAAPATLAAAAAPVTAGTPATRPAPPAPAATGRAPWPGSRSRTEPATAQAATAQAAPATEQAAPATAQAAPPPDTAQATAGAAPATAQASEAPQPDADDAATTVLNTPAKRRFSLRSRLHRPPTVAIVCAAAALVLLGIVAVVGLMGPSGGGTSATTPSPGNATTPAAPPPATSATAQPASPTPEVPVPTTSDAEPSIATEQPTTTTPPATPQAAPPARPHRAAPPLPGVNGPIPGLDKVNQIIQEIEGGLGISGIPQLPGQ